MTMFTSLQKLNIHDFFKINDYNDWDIKSFLVWQNKREIVQVDQKSDLHRIYKDSLRTILDTKPHQVFLDKIKKLHKEDISVSVICLAVLLYIKILIYPQTRVDVKEFWISCKTRADGVNPLILSSGLCAGKWMKEQPSKNAFTKLQVLDLSQKSDNLSDEDYSIFKQDFYKEIATYIPSDIPACLIAGLNIIIMVR